jgi:hypothetical protein
MFARMFQADPLSSQGESFYIADVQRCDRSHCVDCRVSCRLELPPVPPSTHSQSSTGMFFPSASLTRLMSRRTADSVFVELFFWPIKRRISAKNFILQKCDRGSAERTRFLVSNHFYLNQYFDLVKLISTGVNLSMLELSISSEYLAIQLKH